MTSISYFASGLSLGIHPSLATVWYEGQSLHVHCHNAMLN